MPHIKQPSFRIKQHAGRERETHNNPTNNSRGGGSDALPAPFRSLQDGAPLNPHTSASAHVQSQFPACAHTPARKRALPLPLAGTNVRQGVCTPLPPPPQSSPTASLRLHTTLSTHADISNLTTAPRRQQRLDLSRNPPLPAPRVAFVNTMYGHKRHIQQCMANLAAS